MNISILQKIGLTASFLVLVGCGFKMQGTAALPTEVKSLRIVPSDQYGNWQQALRYALVRNGVTIVSGKQAAATLTINEPTITETVHSYNSKGQARQFRSVLNVNYTLTTSKGTKTASINRWRTYSLDPNKLLSNDQEKEIIKEELYREAISELIRQLASPELTNSPHISDENNAPC